MSEIKYKHIPVKNLYSWAEAIISKSSDGDFIPITLQRAKAMSENPYANSDDISMIAAYLGDRCVGYFGAMPIMVQLGEVREKISWFTTWTVAPETRGMGVGSGLLISALTVNEDFMIVGSNFAVRVCEKQGFDKFEVFKYAMIDLQTLGRFNPLSFLLRLSRKISSKIGKELDIEKKIKKYNDKFGKLYTQIFKNSIYSKTIKQLNIDIDEIQINEVKSVSEIDSSLFPSHAFLRDEKIINWMLDYPWVALKGYSATEKMDYYFTDARSEFELKAYEFALKDGEKFGWLTLMLTQVSGKRQVRVLDCLFSESNMPYARQFIIQKAHELGAVQIMGDLNVLQPFSKTSMRLSYTEKTRVYQTMINKNSVYAEEWQKIKQRFADGDMAFT